MASPLSNSVITLLSDLGTRDGAVTNLKALLMQQVPGAAIVDISHNVVQYDVQQAAYLLISAYRHFQKGTIHLLPVDVFAGADPKMLLAEMDGYYFIAPDNGLLPLAFGNTNKSLKLCAEFEKPFSFIDWMNKAVQVTGKIMTGDFASFKLYNDVKGTRHSMLNTHANSIDCGIHYIDRYGNIVLDITQKQFEEMVRSRPFKIKVMRTNITNLSKNYNDVPEEAPLCRFNDAGFLEVALNRASAADLLGLGENNSGNLHYQTIRIFL